MDRTSYLFKRESAYNHYLPFGLFLVSIIPWISPLVVFAQNSTLTYPLFQNDQMHYIARAAAGWHNRNLIEVFSTASYYKSDGLFLPLEYIIFLMLSPLKYFGLSFQLIFLLVVVGSLLGTIIVVTRVISRLMDSRILASTIVCLILFSDVFEKYLNIQKEPLQFSRWPFPGLHYIVLFSVLYFLAKKSLTRRQAFYLAMLLGLSFYTYLYTFLIAWALISVKLSLAIVRRQVGLIRQILIISATSLVLGIPYLQRQFSSFSGDARIKSEAFFAAVNVENSHSLVLSKTTVLLVFLSALILLLKSADKFLLTVSLAALSGAVASAQNLVTGLVIQPGHLHWYWMRPWLYACAFYLFFRLLKTFLSGSHVNKLVMLSFITIFSFSLIVQSVFFFQEQRAKEQTRAKDFVTLLNSDYSDRAVFITFDSKVSDFLVTNTEAKLAYHEYSKFYRGNDDVIRGYERIKEIWSFSDLPAHRSGTLIIEFQKLLGDLEANTILVDSPISKYQEDLVANCRANRINLNGMQLYSCLKDLI